MAKGGGKSSASSGTRKKHAKRAAVASGAVPEEPLPKETKMKKKDKANKKEPRQKMYIPPVKPRPTQPDPLETSGLAHTLPPDLLVVLRSFSKKATVTKTRALEDLQASWVEKALQEGEDGMLVYTLSEMLPVWLHHLPALFVHPSRRVRHLTANLQISFLRIPTIRDQTLLFVRETATSPQLESLLGTWCMAAHDIDRAVAISALKSWNDIISASGDPERVIQINQHILNPLQAFLQRAVLDPIGLYTDLNPPPPIAPPSLVQAKRGQGRPVPSPGSRRDDDANTRSKGEEMEESETDRRARLRIGAFGAVRWLLDVAHIKPNPNDNADGDLTTPLFKNPAFWSSLHFGEKSPFAPEIESFGFGQPNVRKSAWGFIQSLLQAWKGLLEPILPLLSTSILRSAWGETDSNVQSVMWQPLLMFLKEYPSSWELDRVSVVDDDADSDEEDVSEDEDRPAREPKQKEIPSSAAYQEFLHFLELGCSGSPMQGYPTVVVTLSTIPSSILMARTQPDIDPLAQFSTSFWAAIDGRALTSLHRAQTSAAFLSSLLECVTFLIRRIIGHSKRIQEGHRPRLSEEGLSVGSKEDAISFVKDQLSQVWTELVLGNGLKVEGRAAARIVGHTILALQDVDKELFDNAWGVLIEGISKAASGGDAGAKVEGKEGKEPTGYGTGAAALVSVFLKGFDDQFREKDAKEVAAGGVHGHSEKLVEELIGQILRSSIGRLNMALSGDKDGVVVKNEVSFLVHMVEQFRSALFRDGDFSQQIDALVEQHTFVLLGSNPEFLLSYFAHRKDVTRCQELWLTLLRSISNISKEAPSDANQQPEVLALVETLLKGIQSGRLSVDIHPDGEFFFEEVVSGILTVALSSSSSSKEVAIIRQIVDRPGFFLTSSEVKELLTTIISAFWTLVDAILHKPDHLLTGLDPIVALLPPVVEHLATDEAIDQDLRRTFFTHTFLLAYLVPQFRDDEANKGVFDTSREIWTKWVEKSPIQVKEKVIADVKGKLKEIVKDVGVQALPEHVLGLLTIHPPGFIVSLPDDIFSTNQVLVQWLDDLPSDTFDSSLAVIDPLIPPGPTDESGVDASDPASFDKHGFSAYARVVSALLQVLIEDRQLAKKNIWALRHFLVLSLYADDFQKVPGTKNPVFSSGALASGKLALVGTRVRQIVTYLLKLSSATKDDEAWSHNAVDALLSERPLLAGTSDKARFLVDLVGVAKREDSVRDSRVLRDVLQHVLDDVEKKEAEKWITLARKLEKKAPQTSMAIVMAVIRSAPEPANLDRYRNELAASLLGISVASANQQGLLALRKLAASAPSPDSEVEFLPQTRAVNVVKACQSWVAGGGGDDEDEDDEGLGEEVESAMAAVFVHLVPILQNVSGKHWEFIFDVAESGLEAASITEDETLVTLARSLRLVIAIQETVATNKALRADWQDRKVPILTMVRDLAMAKLESARASLPRSICRELVLTIVQDLPESLVDHETLPKMCHLVIDASSEVQRMAYKLLNNAAKKRTEHLVIEAGVETESNVKIDLPKELLDILQQHLGDGRGETLDQEEQLTFGYLLGWMLLFDLFQDASLKVRASYIDQLRSLDILASYFFPNLLVLLRLDEGISKAFKLDVWGIDEFYVDLYEPNSGFAIPVLAAHLYYRALLTLPSLINAWVLDCRDRQLSSTIVTYTAQYFAPVIIKSELVHVRDSKTVGELVDSNFTIKVIQAANEVVASYLVDDHHLEIKLKIPTDWPLHKIEVKDLKRVGVDENLWRAWLLAVQQTIWSHNGRIIDGLGLFKKNVTLHFEGQVECAICYSIISTMDGSLPKKPCKTCKNRFHAGCLFKWFESSHSSSCPLCRSDIM
ncbi:hypothetical protein BDN72DRAFT_260036 [Pluteus cervinus]|uniref:Uncharacterized protein n=1 Tax=Pluteus cervinus TaxID=181527 RepID=A0ACD3AFR9_9AGAR|nr:hypothetical protein BDN72DRAFT_260036 [Pluteus cervinus]